MKLDLLETLSETAKDSVESKIAKMSNEISLGRIHGSINERSAIELFYILTEILIEHQKRESYITLLKNMHDATDKAFLRQGETVQDLLRKLHTTSGPY